MVLDRQTISGFEERLRRMRPDSQRRWGTMSPERLFPHMRRLFEVSLEEVAAPDVSMPLSKTFLFRWGVLNLPWPKGKTKAPEIFLPAPEEDFEAEREKLLSAMRRFVEAYEADPRRKTRSPLLGPITLHDWSRLHAKHLKHHLEQFGE